MTADIAPARGSAPLRTWRTLLLTLVALTGAVSIGGWALLPATAPAAPAAPVAAAAPITVDQCNAQNGGPLGATTFITCTVSVINTINSDGSTSSTTTLTRDCALEPCTGDPLLLQSNDLVTRVEQCNDSGNDAGIPITCSVNITNRIAEGTPNAEPLSAATVNQCNGSGQGGGTNTLNCVPFPASTTGATVTQCNGSGNGGGAPQRVTCTVDPTSMVSAAIPITVNQCNGSGNKGGNLVTCRTGITTEIVAGPAPTPTVTTTVSPTVTPTATVTSTASPTNTPTATVTSTASPTAPGGPSGSPSGSPTAGTPTPTAAPTPAPTSTSTAAVPQVPQVPTGGVQAGSGDGRSTGLLALGLGLLLAAGMSALIRLRSLRRG